MLLNYFHAAPADLELPETARDAARECLRGEAGELLQLVAAAGAVRMKHFGRKVKIHQIHNIQNGLCPEDCGYCGQSSVTEAPINKYPLKSAEEIVAEARAAKARGAYRYCMVSGGRGPTEKRSLELARIIRRVKEEVGIRTCLSVGIINDGQAQLFKEAGLDRLNHNLNTSERHTPNVVTTHTYNDRIETILAAKRAGLSNCSGMICGMGETDEDILDVAYELRRLEVPSIPINFLVPIKGNPLFDFNQLTPERCIRILCVFRLINPAAEIRIGGGREGHLRGLQALALYPANSLFVEGYLVTRGDKADKTIQLIYDAGFEVEGLEELTDNRTSAEKFNIDDDPDIMNPKISKIL